jgi:hypothetical protein
MATPDAYSPCPCGSGKKYKFCCLAKDRDAARDARNGVLHLDPPVAAGPKKAKPPVDAGPPRLYTFEVSILSGPMSDKYEGKVIARTIQMHGSHTLEELHEVIFGAFNREEEHLWEFFIGGEHQYDKRNKSYGPDVLERATDAAETTLNSLGLKEGDAFGYAFDFGDDWQHSVTVTKIEETDKTKMEPKIVKRTGKAPPQYADW